MKDSQAYTEDFGIACAKHYMQWREHAQVERARFQAIDDEEAFRQLLRCCRKLLRVAASTPRHCCHCIECNGISASA